MKPAVLALLVGGPLVALAFALGLFAACGPPPDGWQGAGRQFTIAPPTTAASVDSGSGSGDTSVPTFEASFDASDGGFDALPPPPFDAAEAGD